MTACCRHIDANERGEVAERLKAPAQMRAYGLNRIGGSNPFPLRHYHFADQTPRSGSRITHFTQSCIEPAGIACTLTIIGPHQASPPIPRHPLARRRSPKVESHRLNALMLTASECFFVASELPAVDFR
jgi:hypothetical protein